MSATAAHMTTSSSHADAEESLRAATQWLQQQPDGSPIPPFLQQHQQPPAGNAAQYPPAQNQDDSPTGFRKLQTVPTPPMPLDVQVGGAGFPPGAQQQQPAQQQAGGIMMTAEDIATLTSKPKVQPQDAESAEQPLLAPDAPSSTSQAAIDPVKVLTDGTTAPLSSEEASARVPLPSALDNLSGNAGASTSGMISDVVDWKVGAASLAVAIVLWFIFA